MRTLLLSLFLHHALKNFCAKRAELIVFAGKRALPSKEGFWFLSPKRRRRLITPHKSRAECVLMKRKTKVQWLVLLMMTHEKCVHLRELLLFLCFALISQQLSASPEFVPRSAGEDNSFFIVAPLYTKASLLITNLRGKVRIFK